MYSELKKWVFLFTTISALGACSKKFYSGKSQQPTEPESTVQNERRMDNFTFLKLCMQGNFSSEQQSKNDSDFFDIRLRMVPIWQADQNSFFLYLEQAVSTSTDKPYRQRVYRVEKVDDTTFVSKIYTMNKPERFTGKNSGDEIFSEFTADSLILKDGCEVKLTFNEERQNFLGTTGDRTCPSERSGAAWATSIVSIDEDKMVSWDRGWDNDGKQVWGSVKGGYIFIKDK